MSASDFRSAGYRSAHMNWLLLSRLRGAAQHSHRNCISLRACYLLSQTRSFARGRSSSENCFVIKIACGTLWSSPVTLPRPTSLIFQVECCSVH